MRFIYCKTLVLRVVAAKDQPMNARRCSVPLCRAELRGSCVGFAAGSGVGAVTGRTGFALIFGLRSSTSDCLVMKSESACAVASPTLSSGMCLATETS